MKPLRTERQIAASRANSARSRGPATAKGNRVAAANAALPTGPITPEGKARTAKNAIRHGLLAGTLVFPGESEPRFCGRLATLEQGLQPEPGIETDQVHQIAVAHWRRMRLWSVDKSQRLAAAGHRQEQSIGETPPTTSPAPSAPYPANPAHSNCSTATRPATAVNTGTPSRVSKTTAPIGSARAKNSEGRIIP
jgi:hypothetical protein